MTAVASGLVQSVDWVAVAPPVIAAATALLVLVADLFLPADRKRVLGWLSIAGLALAALALLPLRHADRTTFCLVAHPGTCSYTVDEFALVTQLLVLGGALLAALMSLDAVHPADREPVAQAAPARSAAAGSAAAGSARTGSAPAGPGPVAARGGGGAGTVRAPARPSRTAASRPERERAGQQRTGRERTGRERQDGGLPPGEFWFLLLSSVTGAVLLPASRDLATLVVALEVASLPAFALVGLRREDRLSSEAALKFFLSSVAATAVTLLGVSFVYAATGSLHLSRVAHGLAHVDPRLGTLARAGVLLTLVGFAFKTAAAPFHFWVPDAYVGAPIPVAAYLSVIGKAVGFSGLILVTVLGFPSYRHDWGAAVAVLAALTMTVGNVGALRQRPERAHSAVRLLAWSSVGQAGYLLVPIAAAGYAGSAHGAAHAVGATLTYALMYGAVNLGAFAVVVLVNGTASHAGTSGTAGTAGTTRGAGTVGTAGTTGVAGATGASGSGRVSDYRGLYASRPLVALALGFFLLCLAGLPPGVIGLFAKVTVFASAVDSGLGWLAVVMAVNVVIALYYYLQWTAVLFRTPDSGAGEDAPGGVPGDVPGGAPDSAATGAPVPAAGTPRVLGVAIGLAAAIGVALSAAPQLVLRFAADTLL